MGNSLTNICSNYNQTNGPHNGTIRRTKRKNLQYIRDVSRQTANKEDANRGMRPSTGNKQQAANNEGTNRDVSSINKTRRGNRRGVPRQVTVVKNNKGTNRDVSSINKTRRGNRRGTPLTRRGVPRQVTVVNKKLPNGGGWRKNKSRKKKIKKGNITRKKKRNQILQLTL